MMNSQNDLSKGRVVTACAALLVCVAANLVHADDPLVVTVRRFDIDYSVNDAALPLSAAELFLTTDQGATWTLFGEDEDRQPPMTFATSDDGLFGFYFVLKNAAGASSEPPTRGTQPQTAVLVDQSPPLVQLHSLRLSDAGDQFFVQIRWTAVDTQFGPRPIEITHQRNHGADWVSVTPQPLANTGRFDWRIPDELTGSLAIRVTARDNGGHAVSTDPQTVEVPSARFSSSTLSSTSRPASVLPGRGASIPVTSAIAGTVPVTNGSTTAPGNENAIGSDTAALSGSKRAKERAQRLLTEAIVLGQRGELRDAIARTREAVKLDPESTGAFTEMGDLLLRLGDPERSLNAYEIAIRQKPTARNALVGAARVHTQRKDYPAAAERLRTVLRYNPADAEVWLNLGDVAIYRGDEVAAREYYLRAAQIDPSATKVIDDAKKRLQIMADATKPAPSKKP